MVSWLKLPFSPCFQGLNHHFPYVFMGCSLPELPIHCLRCEELQSAEARGGRRSGLERGGGGREALGGAIEMDRKKTIGKA